MGMSPRSRVTVHPQSNSALWRRAQHPYSGECFRKQHVTSPPLLMGISPMKYRMRWRLRTSIAPYPTSNFNFNIFHGPPACYN